MEEGVGTVSWPHPPRQVQPATPFPLPLLKRAAERQALAETAVLSGPGGIQKFLKPEKALGAVALPSFYRHGH